MNIHTSRRTFLKGTGALFIAIPFNGPSFAQGTSAKTVDAAQVDAYLALHADGTATIYSGKVDLGTGLRAAFPQIAAEELGLPIGRIKLIEGDSALTPDQGPTSGSNGIPKGGMQLRQAAATARQALIKLGAEKLGRPAGELDAIDGEVRPKAGGGAGVSFASLIGDKGFELKLDAKAPVRDPKTYRLVGKHVPRPDVPAKVTGQFEYMHNVEVPGMLHGRVVRPAKIGASLVSVDEASIASIPGAQVVRIKNFLGVVAPDEWDAVRALRLLKATWSGGGLPVDDKGLADYVRASKQVGDEMLDQRGDFNSAYAAAPKKLTADFYWPVQSHASLGPSCAIADVKDGAATIWCSSQGTHRYAKHFADMLGIPLSKTRVHYADGAGCYGMNAHEDAAADAAFLSRAVGKPVRVQWTREDEHALDPKGPAQVITQEAALSDDGKIVAWRTQMWCPKPTDKLPTIPLLSPAETESKQVPGIATGSLSSGGKPPYDIPNLQVQVHWLESTPLRPSHLRAPGKIGNCLAVETMMDEMALMAGQDPVAFRLAYLSDPRGREAIERVAKLFNWDARVQPRRNGRGRGIGFTQYKGDETYVAIAMEVEVDASGRIRVTRVAATHDCGQIISPDGVRSQVEGCILQTIGRTLYEEVKFDRDHVTSRDWSTYPILTFTDLPDMKIELIDRPDQPPRGAGEAATAPVAAALANAVFDATGVRLRRVPFTAPRVKAAMVETVTKNG